MKPVSENLLKIINKAHKESDKLRLKAGYKHLKYFKLSFNDITEIELKLSPDEFSLYRENKLPIFDANFLYNHQFAYFYNRKDCDLMSCEKIFNNKLKEYYTGIFEYGASSNSTSYIPRFEKMSKQSLIEFINITYNENMLYTGFIIDDVFFEPIYLSFDISSNEPDEIYFYSSSEKKHFFIKEEDYSNYIEIIRINLKTNKISQIYSEITFSPTKHIFKYYKDDNFSIVNYYLVSVN